MKNFKKVLPMVLATTALFTLAACSGDSDSDSSADSTSQDNGEVTQLEFWGWWSSEARKPHIDYMVNAFNESQDDIEVEYVDVPWSDISTKNIAQIAAGDPCDVIVAGLESVGTRATNSQLTLLNDYIPDGYLDNFYDNFAEAVVIDGDTYSVPLVGDTRYIYYNKDLFNEIGISEENGNMPDTWDELQDVAFQLDQYNDDGTIDVVGFHPMLGNGGADTWITNANQGICWYDPETNEANINTELNLETFDYIDSYTDHYTSRVYDEYSAAFSSGMADPFCSEKLGMLIQTNAYLAAIDVNAPDLNYGIMLMPEMTEGNGHGTTGGGFSIEVPYGAKDPAASMEFIEWMTSPDMQAYWGLNMGEVPTRNDVDSEELNEKLVYQKSLEALPETYIQILPPELTGLADLMTSMIDLGLTGQMPMEEALQQAEDSVTATYGIEAK